MKQDIFESEQIEDIEKKAFFGSYAKSKSPLRILLGMYKGNYGYILLSILFFILQYAPVIALPICTANIINCAVYPDVHPMSELWLNVAILAVCIIVNSPACICATYFRSTAMRRVEALLRSAIARKLQQLSITFWKEMESGRMQSKIMRDVENIEILAGSILTTLMDVVIVIVAALVVTTSRNLIMLAFFAIALPVGIFLITFFRKKISVRNQEYRHDVENATASVNEMVELLPVTKAHSLEKTALNRFEKSLFRVAYSGYQLDRINSIFGSTAWVILQLFQLSCLVFATFLAINKIIEVGEIAMYQSYFAQIISAVSTVIALLPSLSKGFDSVRSIGDIMWAMDTDDDDDKQKVTDVKGEFSFQNVKFWYPDDQHPILRGFNLNVKAGETIALVGESGSGKSTALNMIIGFYRPAEGRILLDGVDMKDINLKSYRAHIATVPQTSVLFNGTVRDNITYGLSHYTEEQVEEAVKAANLTEVIAKLPQGLDTNVGEHGDKLSGGQRQRIAIARAVIRNASIIIFDEATSALDSASEKLIQDAIERVSKNRTTFIVAHRLSTIRNADKIAVIKDGVCAEFGTYDELMAKQGEFYRFKMLQS